MSEAMDIYSAVYPTNCISRVLGLTSHVAVGLSGSRRFQDSKTLICYNVSVITFLATLGLLKLTLFMQNPDYSFFKSVRVVDYTVTVITNIIIRLACLLQKDKLKLFYKTLSKIDKNFQNINQTYSQVFWRLVYALLVTFMLLSFYFVGRCKHHLANNTSGIFSTVISCLLIITSSSTFLVLIIDFTCSVYFINQRFRALQLIIGNSFLLELPHSVSESHSPNARTVPLSTLREKLQVVVKIHGLLCDASSLLTSAFSVQILFITGVSFVTVTYSSYFCVVSFLDQSKGVFAGLGWNLIALYWLILIFLSNTALLSACDTATHEVRVVFNACSTFYLIQ
jgi:hypothetical protein